MRSVSPEDACISAVTLAEMQCGAMSVADPAKRQEIEAWLQGLVVTVPGKVAVFGQEAGFILGRLWANSALDNFIRNDPRGKRAKSGANLAIAAIAIAGNLVVATANSGDFLEIHAQARLPGLFDPLDGTWHVPFR